MIVRSTRFIGCGFLIAILLCSICCQTKAAVVEVGTLNIISDAGNSSNGLGYLDMFYSDNKTLVDALAAAQIDHPTARLATISETDDLFDAAGIGSGGIGTAGYAVGGTATLASGAYDGHVLSNQLGFTSALGNPHPDDGQTLFWTDPDGDNGAGTTRDLIDLHPTSGIDGAVNVTQTGGTPSSSVVGFLLVAPAPIPEPSSLVLAVCGLLSLGFIGSRRRNNRTSRRSSHESSLRRLQAVAVDKAMNEESTRDEERIVRRRAADGAGR